MRKFRQIGVGAAMAAALWSLSVSAATPVKPNLPAGEISDAALVKKLPGFRNQEALVNGVHHHYVQGAVLA